MTDEKDWLFDGPRAARLTIALAHGAGAPMDSPFMRVVAEGLAKMGYRVVRFEFPYMHARREAGKRRAPDREPALLKAWRYVISRLGDGSRLVIGGKSMGGRIASMVADETGVAGLVCLGYPFHPPGQPLRQRVAHLENLRTPTLIVQGTRDQFGRREEVGKYPLSPQIRIAWIENGDHSFKPPARAGVTAAQNINAAINTVDDFLKTL